MPACRRRLTSASVLVASLATVLGGLALGAPAASAAEDTSVLDKSASPGPVSTSDTQEVTRRAPKKSAKVQRALSVARAQTGDPYSYGAAGPNAFDCSGLVYYAARKAGIKGVPRTSSAQSGWARRIPRSAMKPGDLVFFTNGGGVYHVGFYVGKNQILHAPYSGTRVRRERIWTSSWFAGTLRGR